MAHSQKIVDSCSILITARSSSFQMDIDMSRRNKKPRLLLESERERLEEFIDSIHYSARYIDSHTVTCIDVKANFPADIPMINLNTVMFSSPKTCLKRFRRTTLTARKELLNCSGKRSGELWVLHRCAGPIITVGFSCHKWSNFIDGQSLGWEHYEVHEPEPHILLFK